MLIKQYNHNGQLIKTIGSRGNVPGQFSLAYGLAHDPQDNLYVLDLNQSRVHIFDSSGTFQISFAFSHIGTPGIALAIANSGDIYVGGFAAGVNAASTKREKHVIHKFDREGNHLLSFFPLDEQVEKLNLQVVGGVRFSINSSGNLYAIQQVTPQFFKFSPNGQLLGRFGGAPSFYKAPFDFPSQLPNDKSRVNKLLARWTQLIDIHLIPDNLVLLTYRIHSPMEYAIEIYDEVGRLVKDRIGSDLLPLFSDKQNTIYFRRPQKQGGQSSMLKLSRFTINLT